MSIVILTEGLFEVGLIRGQPGKDIAIHAEETVVSCMGRSLVTL